MELPLEAETTLSLPHSIPVVIHKSCGEASDWERGEREKVKKEGER